MLTYKNLKNLKKKLIPLKSTVGPLTGSETIQILEVILRVVYVILMMEMILGGDSYEKSCWYWFRRHSGTTDWVWDITMVILGRDSED